MMKKGLYFFSVLVVVSLLAGCEAFTWQPIVNLKNEPVTKGLSDSQVATAIKSGVKHRGWRVLSSKPGLIVAAINVRRHYARVNIAYTKHNYSITYNSSRNLNAEDGQIHRNYNKWVTLLDRSIQKEFHHAKIS